MNFIVHIEKKLKNFTLKVDAESGESCLGILGASGCGKSMTLKCIAGIVTPEKGYIELNGKVLFDSGRKINLTPQQRRVGYLFQNYALFPNMTVCENIGVGIKASKKEKVSILSKLIQDFKLDGLENQYPGRLSGGQQQRVALARLLAYEPEALLLDEPFTAMDSYLKEELQLLLQGLLHQYHGNAIMVTHSLDEIYRFCNDMIVIDNGKIQEYGKAKKIFVNPEKVQTARLVGCQNITRAVKVSDYQVEALDWGCVLTVDRTVSENITHAGIRAHDVRVFHEPGDNSSLLCGKISKISESPFEWNLLIQMEENQNKQTIMCKTRKDQFNSSFKEQMPVYLAAAPEDILLLES